MDATQLRLALAARCGTTRTHYGKRGSEGNALEKKPLPTAPLPARCGIYPVAPGDDRTAIGVIDLDNHEKPPLPWENVVEAAQPILAHLRTLGHYPLPFRSSGGLGIHIWLVWDVPQQALAVRMLLIDAAGMANLTSGDGGLVKGQAEIFPKQASVPPDGWGACIDLPLGAMSCPLHPDTLAPVTEIPLLVTSRPLDPKKVLPVKEKEVDWDEGRVRSMLAAIPADEYEDWVNVLRALQGGAARAKVDARAIAEEWSKTSEKHSSREFAQKWDRGFPKERNSQGRSLGTLYWLAKKHGWQPPAPPCCVVKIRVQDSSPKLYLVTIFGDEEREVPMRSPELNSKLHFVNCVLEYLDRIITAPKPDDLNLLLAVAEHIEVDGAATTLGQFKTNLLAYLDESLHPDKEELRLSHRSWRDAAAGRTYFKWGDFSAWLKRQRNYDVKHTEAYHMIGQLGGGKGRVDLGEKYGKVSAWWAPLDPREKAPEPAAARIPAGVEAPF